MPTATQQEYWEEESRKNLRKRPDFYGLDGQMHERSPFTVREPRDLVDVADLIDKSELQLLQRLLVSNPNGGAVLLRVRNRLASWFSHMFTELGSA